MLVRIWRKKNPYSLLVGVQTSIAIMEISMEVSKKLKWNCHMTLVSYIQGPSYPTSEILIISMLVAFSFTAAENWNQPIIISTDDCIKKMWVHIHSVILFSCKEKIKFIRKLKNLEGIILSKVTQNDRNHIFS